MGVGPGDSVDAARNADLAAQFAIPSGGPSVSRHAARAMLFPAEGGARRASGASHEAPREPGVTVNGDGVEMNFEQADVQTVAKALLGDTLGLDYVVDPRLQGSITIVSAGPIPRKDILPTFESVLRMSSMALLRDGRLVKIVPLPEANGAGHVKFGAVQAGYGVTVVPLRYSSAATLAKTAENFLSRSGAIRADTARNLIYVQGTSTERQAALDMIAGFDVEWLRNQSVGVFPLKSVSPDTMIRELERIFGTMEGGAGAGTLSFQPVTRMNAVMAVTGNQRLLERVSLWVARLDRSDMSGTTVRVYRLENGNATRIAKMLSEIFVGKSAASTGESAASQIAPGIGASQSKMDQISTGGGFASSASASSASGSGASASSGSGSQNSTASAFAEFSEQRSADAESRGEQSAGSSGALPRGVFPNVRITADSSNNSIVVFSNHEDYRVIERSIRELDRPQLQVSIEATVAEVSLTDALQYGVQYYIGGSAVGAKADQGSASLSKLASSAILERVLPGFNLLLGPEAQPHVVLNALATITNVKVLSSPSLVVADNQPALLQVGQEIPVSTGSATVLSTSNTVVNTIQMRDTGVILKVWPRVHANGTIQLEVEQEISNPVDSTLTPTISKRRIHSTVSITSGQTVLLGGLISEQDDKTKDGIPGLRHINYLGDLFGSTNGKKNRTEIIVFIKPRIIRGELDAQGVAEEFRSRLETMHAAPNVVSGAEIVRVSKIRK
jgi:general secretion pathway protein D